MPSLTLPSPTTTVGLYNHTEYRLTPQHACEHPRTPCKSWVSPSPLCVLHIKLRLPVWPASLSTCRATSPAQTTSEPQFTTINLGDIQGKKWDIWMRNNFFQDSRFKKKAWVWAVRNSEARKIRREEKKETPTWPIVVPWCHPWPHTGIVFHSHSTAYKQILIHLVQPTDFNTYIMTPMSHCKTRAGKFHCFKSVCSALTHSHEHHLSFCCAWFCLFRSCDWSPIVHRLFRKCFFPKNAGWGFLDWTVSFLPALSKLTIIYLDHLPTDSLVTCEFTIVNKAAINTCRFHQWRVPWSLGQTVKSTFDREKRSFNVTLTFVHTSSADRFPRALHPGLHCGPALWIWPPS